MPITPPYLQKGDIVGICAPAGKVNQQNIIEAIKLYESWGLKVITTPHLFHNHYRFSGTDEQRLSDAQILFDNEEVKAILCARGGYGSNKILDEIDFTSFLKSPKWLVGFSDITQFHAKLHQYKIESVHGQMPNTITLGSKEGVDTLKRVLFGEELMYSIPTEKESRLGEATGELVGGNLAILISLMGTPLELDTKEKILFIEDIDEYWYHHDRMLNQLDRAGKLKGLKGLIVGQFSEMKDSEDSFGTSPLASIQKHVEKYDFPVIYNFPAGHVKDNRAIILGREITMSVLLNTTSVHF